MTSDSRICSILERCSEMSVSESDSSDSAGSDSDQSTVTKGTLTRNLKSEPLIFQTGTAKTNLHILILVS